MSVDRCKLYHSYCLMSKAVHNLGNTIRQMRRDDLSEPTQLFAEAVELKRRYSSTDDLLTSLRGHATILASAHQYRRALEVCSEAVEVVCSRQV